MMETNQIMTLEEVAKYLRVSERTVYEWAQKGEIPAGKIGTSWRFKSSDIERWVDARLGSDKKKTTPPSVRIEKVLKPERVVILSARTKVDALNEMIETLAGAPEVKKHDELSEEIFRRETLMSTGIGLGIAVPHVRLNSVTTLTLAAGLSRHGIADYESLDGKPVHCIVMVAAAKNQHSEYLRMLAYLSFLFKQQDIRDKILNAPDGDTLFRLLVQEG